MTRLLYDPNRMCPSWTTVLVLAYVITMGQAMKLADVPQDFEPYHDIVGGITIALAVILAVTGKGALRLYAAVCGTILGAFISYLVMERYGSSHSLGPNKDILEVIVAVISGLVGASLFLWLLGLVVVGVGVLFGLILTAFLISLPVVSKLRHIMPLAVLAVIVVVLCVAVTWFMESMILSVVSALVGGCFTAIGLDMILQTGFNEQVIAVLTKGLDRRFVVRREMLPLLYAFAGVFVVGIIAQVWLARRAESRASKENMSVRTRNGRGGVGLPLYY